MKKGLLGTLIQSQREIYQKGGDHKIVVVPLTLSYHVVLEAPQLIRQFLKATGEEKYIFDTGKPPTLWQVLKFAWKFFSLGAEIVLSFGDPMDVFGYELDSQAKSLDKAGHEVNIQDYFSWNGRVGVDRQRENVYTKILAERIVGCYHSDNIVLSSHLVAYTAFYLLSRQSPDLDVFGLIRLNEEHYEFKFDDILDTVEKFIEILKEMETQGQVKLAERLHGDLVDVIHDGVRKLGIYHNKRPLYLTNAGHYKSQDFRLLYFITIEWMVTI